ncbi:1,2-phenylacetyl-CoA epoxidase subunit PaaD [Nocardioides ferulae]|uniref:1,2-phenylacetyl-CoA epoxidase subunit PaaD n=1 Tax=Nocardioides ferulae TaxID=2340821 RepID=UPI001F0CBB1A|nr:1,2-phenylacetyl-CoA epoxidase subunit PaaD [Nocardioides ferulae]
MTTHAERRQAAWLVAAAVPDPELPMLTLADLGVLRAVEVAADGAVEVVLTPTWSGCPALATMRDDVVRRVDEAGLGPVRVLVELLPAWSSDDISPQGRRALAEHGVSPPRPGARRTGPVPLSLGRHRAVSCPRCDGAAETLSAWGPTPCTSLHRCGECGEPFQHIKEVG